MLTTCDKRRNNYPRLHIIYELFALRRSKKIPTSQYFISKLSLPSAYLLSVPSRPPVMVSDPLADGCSASLLQILRGNEGEIRRSYLHTRHIIRPTRPISTTSLSSQSWRKLDFRWEIIKLTEMTERWVRVHVVGAGWWVVPGEAAR